MSKRKFEGETGNMEEFAIKQQWTNLVLNVNNVELEDFVKNKRRPTFDSFVTQHLKDLSKWSTSLIHLKEHELFAEWRNRFVQALATYEKQNLVLR